MVKAFGREGATVEAYERDNDALFNAGWKAQFLSGLMMPVLGFVGNLGYVAVAVSGAFFAVTGAITVGDIQAFIQYVKNFTQPITQLAQVSNVLQSLAAAAERIFAFLDLPEMDEAFAPGKDGAEQQTKRVLKDFDKESLSHADSLQFIRQGLIENPDTLRFPHAAVDSVNLAPQITAGSK